jgi:predicted Zn-dependent protease
VADGVRAALAALLIVVASAAYPAAPLPVVPEPTIPPGYVPVKARDERGIWRELEEYEKSLARSPLRVRDPALNDYIENLVCRIAGDYCSDFRVYVVRNAYFNASMAANGLMQVWTGLLTRMSSEDELATVIGHEIAHYQRAHTLAQFRKIRKGMAVGSIFDFGLLLVGVPLPLGQMTAILDMLAFSRAEEEEADLLGARLMAQAGFDPHATYRVWHTVIAEDHRAEIKREEPGIFSKTHPDAEARAKTLEAWVTATYGPPTQREHADTAFAEVMAGNIERLMEDQIRTARFGRTEFLIERQAEAGMRPALVNYFRGQMLMQRAGEGDVAAARTAYEASVAAPDPPPRAFRDLGYLLLKLNDPVAARAQFARYLELDPLASDRAMIEFYLEDPE